MKKTLLATLIAMIIVVVGGFGFVQLAMVYERYAKQAEVKRRQQAELAAKKQAEQEERQWQVEQRILERSEQRQRQQKSQAETKREVRGAALNITLGLKKRESDKILGNLNKEGRPFTPQQRQAQRDYFIETMLANPGETPWSAEDEAQIRRVVNTWWR